MLNNVGGAWRHRPHSPLVRMELPSSPLIVVVSFNESTCKRRSTEQTGWRPDFSFGLGLDSGLGLAKRYPNKKILIKYLMC